MSAAREDVDAFAAWVDAFPYRDRDDAGTVVVHTRDHRGMLSSICPQCHVMFTYWDDDDLDDDGALRCYCAVTAHGTEWVEL